MQNKTKTLITGCLIGVALLAGCMNHVQETEDQIDMVYDESAALIEKARIPYTPEPIDTVVSKDDIWLGQDSFKIIGGEPLPAWLSASDALTFSTSEPVDLPTLVDQLRELTGLRFSLDELRASDSFPEDDISVNYEGSLDGLLDLISNKYGIWWRYRKGEVSFYQMETRVFTVYALPTETSMSASLSGSPSESASGGTTSTSLSSSVNLSLWTHIENGLNQIIGSNGELVVSPPTGTVTVTAPPFVIQKVARYVQDINEKMSRQVAISVKILQVSLENQDMYGLNLDAVFTSGSIASTFTGPFTPADGGGMLTMTLLDSKWKNSSSIIQALSTQGKTSLVTSTSVTTLNNKVAPVQVTTSQNYVKQTTIDQSNYDSNSTSVELETDTLNYGFTMELLPRILDNGRLIMLFTMTLTDLISLTTFSSSGKESSGDDDDDTESGGSGQTSVVQLPKLQTRGFVQEIAMRSGSTLVLTGFETLQDKTDQSGVGRPRISLLGGKAYASQTRNVLVILLTPEILVSPLSPETRMENF